MFSARFSASAVFPCEGRAARMISSEGCRPESQLVEFTIAGGNAGDALPFAEDFFEALEIVADDVFDGDEAGFDAVFGDGEDAGLGAIQDGIGAVFAFKRRC